MKIRYNRIGSERKALVRAIEEITECTAQYLGAPTFAYQVDYFTIEKDGTLEFDDRADSEEIENLLEQLAERPQKCLTRRLKPKTRNYPQKPKQPDTAKMWGLQAKV